MSGTKNQFAYLPASPIVLGLDAPDGSVRVEWRHFFHQLWTRTGGSVAGGPPIVGDAPSDGHTYGRLNASWTQVLPLSGGTMTGVLTLSGAPAGANDAANKGYVDSHVSSVVGAYLPLTGGTLTGPLVDQNSPYTPLQVYQMAYPAVVFSDTVDSSAYVPASFAGTQMAAVGGYIVSDAPVSAGWHNAVALMGVGVAHADNSNTWGLNTLLTDSANATIVSSGVGRLLQNELDFNVTSPNTVVFGLTLAGASVSQPSNAYAVVIDALGTNIRWGTGLLIQNNAANFAITIGYSGASSGASLNSQQVAFFSTDGTGAAHSVTLQALTGNILAINAAGTAINGQVGFNSTTPIAKPTITGAKGGNAALGSLLTALVSYGLITDATSP